MVMDINYSNGGATGLRRAFGNANRISQANKRLLWRRGRDAVPPSRPEVGTLQSGQTPSADSRGELRRVVSALQSWCGCRNQPSRVLVVVGAVSFHASEGAWRASPVLICWLTFTTPHSMRSAYVGPSDNRA